MKTTQARGKGINRRSFVKTMLAAAAAPLYVPGTALGLNGRTAASERICMGAIGTGGQGSGDMRQLMGFSQVQMLAVCDVSQPRGQTARNAVNQRYGNQDCQLYGEFRDLLGRNDIDAVLIATPDHWHAIIAIEACKAGKDIYCEKPESLTVREGRAMADAVRRYGRVFSGGSQRVLGDYQNGVVPWLIRSGAIGRVREVYVNCGGPSYDCYLPEQPIPAGLDWDRWIGPSPWRPYNAQLYSGWRAFRDFSGGGMTDWGAHRFGAAMYACGVEYEGPTEIIPPDGRENRYLTYRFSNGLTMYHGGTNNITYKGTDGEWPGQTLPVRGPTQISAYRGTGGIMGDFLHCCRTRETPFRNIEAAHRTASVCHLGNIAYWLNRPLRWDHVREGFGGIGDQEATRWLDRPRREPWTLG
jgi:hypothetical protein